MPKYPFLSDEWVAEARRIRAEHPGADAKAPVSVRMNVIVKGTPSGTLDAHLDTSGGVIDLETGHLDKPDLTVTVDAATARSIFVDGDPQVAMQAFLGGKIKVDGDISKLLAMQSTGTLGSVDASALELAKRLQDITE